LLQKDHEAQIARVNARWEFRLEVEGDIASFFKFSDLFHLLDDRHVGQALSSVFPPLDLRFGMVQRDRTIDIGPEFL
jgi:hypothetical protein